jgi:hypothetical protein
MAVLDENGKRLDMLTHQRDHDPDLRAYLDANPPTEEELALVKRTATGKFAKGMKVPKAWTDTSNMAKRRKRKLKDKVYQELRDAINNDDEKETFYSEFLKKYMDAALHNTSGPEAAFMAKTILSDTILDDLDANVDKGQDRDIDFLRYRIRQTLYAQQKPIFDDIEKRRVIGITSRRWGKTILNSRLLAGTAAIPKSPIFYINLTFQNALDQMWDETIKTLEKADLSFKPTASDGIIEISNGSIIHFKGNNTKADTEKMRGYKARLVIIDEIQSQRNLKGLIEDVVEPLLMDYEDSRLILTGTPSRIEGTYAEELYKQYRDFPTPTTLAFNGCILDNPYIPNAEQELELICQRKGVTRDNSLIQREYLGVVGAYDKEACVFGQIGTYKGDIPESFFEEPVSVVIGVDYGFNDYNAVIGLVFRKDTGKAYVYYEAKFNQATVTEIINKAREALDKGKGLLMKNPRNSLSDIGIYCDTNEKSITYEMTQTYQLPAYNAWKYNKDMAISQLKEDMQRAQVLVPKDGIVEEESRKTIYKRDKDTDAILNEIDDNAFHPDALMALLYASRQYYYEMGNSVGGQSNQTL